HRRPHVVRPDEAVPEAVLPHAAGQRVRARQRGLSRLLSLADARSEDLRGLEAEHRLGPAVRAVFESQLAAGDGQLSARRGAVKKVVRGLVISTALGVAVYVGFAAYSDWGKVRDSLASFRWVLFAGALGLAATNYLIRFVRWHYYLGRLELS